MHRLFHFICYVSFTALFGCAAGKSTTTKTAFNDNLTPYRVSISTIEENKKQDPTVEEEQQIDWSSLTPATSVTEEVRTIVSSISLNNLKVASFPGFRIQVYSAGNRDKAKEIIKYLEEELELEDPVYLHYEQPNFKVKIGDYANRLKAHEIHSQLKEEYPYSIVIRDNIKFDLNEYVKAKKTDEKE